MINPAITPLGSKLPGGKFPGGKFPGGKFPGGKGGFGQTCVSGRVNLLQFIQAPAPGSIIGTLTTSTGQQIGLIQGPGFFGGGLAQADQQFATVCGRITFSGGQPALVVTTVLPGTI